MWGRGRRGNFSLLLSLLAGSMAVAQEIQNYTNIVAPLEEAIRNEVLEVAQPIEEAIIYVESPKCEELRKLLGVSYEQLRGVREPDLNRLTLVYRFELVTEIINLNNAVEVLRHRSIDDMQDFIMYVHGATDDPFQERFGNISEAYLTTSHTHVAALDAGPLLRRFYLRSSAYARFIGERLGQVLVALVQHGQDPDRIHLIGHSLGAQISGFAGKTFYNETGINIGRITGLDPAGPCFSQMGPEHRLEASDAKFVDVIHTNPGVYGLQDAVGDADYFPNSGSLQPSCKTNVCSHERSWLLYSASVKNPYLFPAIKCNNWDDFKKGHCSDEISYMGFGAEPTRGRFYLQTSGEYPYGLGEKGLEYRNTNGLIEKE